MYMTSTGASSPRARVSMWSENRTTKQRITLIAFAVGVFFYATNFATRHGRYSIYAVFSVFSIGIRSLRGMAKKNPVNPQKYRVIWS